MRDLNILPQNIVEILISLVQEKIKRDGKGKINPSGKGAVICLYHEESNPSLAFNLHKGLVNCFGCGKKVSLSKFLRDLKEHLGYNFSSNDADYKKLKEVEENLPEIVSEAVFTYTDENGRPSCYKWRKDFKDGSKEFNLFNPDGQELRHYFGLYALHLVARANEVYFVEGEKVADALIQLGLVATTLCRGASGKLAKPEKKALLTLKGKKVYLLPDADKAGFQYMGMVARFLNKKGIESAFIKPPDNLTDGEDLYDYIQELRNQGLKDDEIKERIISLTNTPKPFEKVVNIEAKQTEWVIPKWFAKGKLSLIVGDPGVGKSTLAICLGLIKASGGVVPTDNGFERVERGKVLYVPFEEDPSEVSFIAKLQEIPNFGENFYVWKDATNFNLNQLEKEKIDLIIVDPMTYIYAEKQRKDITADAYKMLKPYKQLAEKKGCSIVFVWHTRKNKNNIVDSVLSSRIISAMVKRIILVDKDENDNRRIFFEKGYPLPSMLFEIKNRMLKWVGIDDISYHEFNEKVPRKEIAKEILEELEKVEGNQLSRKQILSLVKPYSISEANLRQIKSRYLRDKVEIVKIRTDSGFNHIWRLKRTVTPKNCHSHENKGISTVFASVTFSENKDKNFCNAKNPLKINELEIQEKNDCIVDKCVTVGKSLKINDLRTVTVSKCHSDIAKAKTDNSLENKDFFSLKVPVIPEWLLKKYKIENPEIYEDPDFREFAIGHIVNHSKQKRPDGPEKLPVIVIDGKEFIDADELFKMEG
jgi:ABC-type oligopeptide transport system ATPase subunit